MRVPNAMTVKTVSRPNRPSAPFSLAQRVERHTSCSERTYLYPIALNDVMDLLIPRIKPFTMLTGVDTYRFTETGTIPLTEPCDHYRVTVLAEDSDTLVIATADLLTLFGELHTYNLTAFDLAASQEDCRPADAVSGMDHGRSCLARPRAQCSCRVTTMRTCGSRRAMST